ncbi:MAG: carbohydrate kinase [Chitinophagaceae bacterium]|nr:carbohydrate kinase [Chitinophagaceae bacterium]
MKKILCIGEALIDMICTDKGKPLSEGVHFVKKAGGAPTNVAAAVAAFGGAVHLAAKVGNDPFGHHLIQVLQFFGVNTNWVLQDEQHFTTFAFVSLMENGERDFYFNRGADGELSEQDINTLEMEDYGIIHFGSATAFLPGRLNQTYHSLFKKAQTKNIFISFDPNYRHLLYHNRRNEFIQQSIEFISKSHFFKVSDEEALLITGQPTVEQAADAFFGLSGAVFAITLGNRGAILGINRKKIVIESIKVQVVDTTGAGDAFVGAVLFQLAEKNLQVDDMLHEEEWKKIIYNANKAGAHTCAYLGAMEAFRHLNKSVFLKNS